MTTIDHPEIPMDRQKPWRTGLSLLLVAFGIFSFSALLHYHVVHEGRSAVGSPLLAPALGLSSALGFAAALSFSLLLTLWASLAFVTDRWAGPMRRIWISLVFALCLSVFVSGLDYDGGELGGPIATRMAHVLGGDFSTFLLGILTLLGFLLATNWLFFENFLSLARGRQAAIESGLGDVEEQLLGARNTAERDEILKAYDVSGFAKPASLSAQQQDVAQQQEVEQSDGSKGSVAVATDSAKDSAKVEPTEERPGLAISGSLRVQPRVGRAIPVPEPQQGAAAPSGSLPSGGGMSAEDLESTRDRRDRIRSARLRRDQEVLEEILEEVRSSIGPELDPMTDREGRDPMADLDDDLLLEKAGQALDELLGEGGGSLELNLPTQSDVDESGVRGSEASETAPESVSAESDSSEKGDDQGRLGSEPRIQTPMGRIPVVDGGTGDRTETGSTQEDLFASGSRELESRLSSPRPDLDADAEVEASAESVAPADAETDLEREAVAEGPETVEPHVEEPTFQLPRVDEKAAHEQAAEEPADDESTAGDDEAQEQVEVETVLSEDKAAEDVESVISEAAEPVFILEPQPSVRIYHEPQEGETEEFHQEELFAAEPPDPELLDRAARVLLTSRRPTVSLLQRRIGLSYAEARQVMLYMQQLGALAAPDGGGPWGALISLGEWDERRA